VERADPEAPLRGRGEAAARRIAAYIERVYAEGKVLGDDERYHEVGLMSVPRAEGEFIAGLVRSERPRATLEIGMAWGVSTLFILRALFENGGEFRPHVVIDPFEASVFHNAARRALNDLEIADRVEFYEEPSDLTLARLLRDRRSFDLAFVDGNHRFDCVFTDLRFIHQLLKPGGVVIFDDTDWDGVNLACRFAETNFKYVPIAALPRSGADEPVPDRAAAPWRPRACAYRKPMGESNPPPSFFVPFFLDFLPPRLIERMLRTAGRDMRHKGHAALRAGDRALARRYFQLALRSDPGHLKTWLRLIRTYLPRPGSRSPRSKPR
jgi:predicted O-methyltransferase YrrM